MNHKDTACIRAKLAALPLNVEVARVIYDPHRPKLPQLGGRLKDAGTSVSTRGHMIGNEK